MGEKLLSSCVTNKFKNALKNFLLKYVETVVKYQFRKLEISFSQLVSVRGTIFAK